MLNSNNFEPEEKDIDVQIFLKIFLYYKNLIFKTVFLGFIIGIISSLVSKRIWEGQFQIVLNNENGLEEVSNNKRALSFLQLQNSNDLDTEVAILNSPSVLMPIFEYAKSLDNDKKNDDLKFRSWKKNLKVELEKGTSVLNISYQNQNKKSIIPILEKLSNKYKAYSTNKNKKELNSIIKFLKKELEIYDQKSRGSYKLLQNFAIENNFSVQSSFQPIDNNFANLSSVSPINLTSLEDMKIRLKKLSKSDLDNSEIIMISTSIPEIEKDGLIEELGIIERNLSLKKSVFSEGDNDIKNLERKKSSLIKFIKDKSINVLEAKIKDAEIAKQASNNSKETILKFRDLQRESIKDDITFTTLDNNLRKYQIEKSKDLKAWDLITEPTLLDYPVDLSRKKRTLFFTFIGGLIGLILGFIFKNLNKIIVSDTEITKSFKSEPLEFINLNFDKTLNSLKIIIESIINKNLIPNESLFILFPCEQEGKISRKIKDFLNSNFNKSQIIFSINLDEITSKDNVLLIVDKNETNMNEIKTISKAIFIGNIKFIGWISSTDKP